LSSRAPKKASFLLSPVRLTVETDTNVPRQRRKTAADERRFVDTALSFGERQEM